MLCCCGNTAVSVPALHATPLTILYSQTFIIVTAEYFLSKYEQDSYLYIMDQIFRFITFLIIGKLTLKITVPDCLSSLNYISQHWVGNVSILANTNIFLPEGQFREQGRSGGP